MDITGAAAVTKATGTPNRSLLAIGAARIRSDMRDRMKKDQLATV